MSITTAVILAAGMGTRLKEQGTQMPKGFLRLGERPIIAESIARLQRAGITRIVIVTGHLASFYEELKAGYDGAVETVHNPRYADSGSLYSLYQAREVLDEDFLLLESDLIYERRALAALLGAPQDDVVLLSGATGAGDEVYVQTDGDLLVSMSKRREALESVRGELVGITRVSKALFAAMCDYAERGFRDTLRLDYETDCLVGLAAGRPIHTLLVEDLLWSEIDDAAHLQRARARVYPAILGRDG